MSPQAKEKVASFLTNEYKRLSSRKLQVWLVSSGFYAVALGVYLRTISMSIWNFYLRLGQATVTSQAIVEATSSLTIFTDLMKMLTWYYGFMCLLYCAANIVDKVVAWKFGKDQAPRPEG